MRAVPWPPRRWPPPRPARPPCPPGGGGRRTAPSQWPAIALTLVLGAASFCALGVAVASVISNAEAAPAVAQLVLFPLLFLSGTYMPIHSAVLNRVTGWLPIRPFNVALTGPLARHTGIDWRELAILAAWGVIGALVAIRRFRWDPRPE